MGRYINPPDLIFEIGREIDGYSFEELQQQLNPDENLFGMWFRLYQGFYNAVWLKDQLEYKSFIDQQKDGNLSLIGFYAVPETEFSVR